MRILVAEDEQQLSHVLSSAMTASGYQVDIANNGQEAVEQAKENAYDVIILDIMMPVKSGLEALKEIRATGNRTYIMMLTAMGEEDDKVTGLDAGADDYLTKPFSLKELLARLRSRQRRDDSYQVDVLEFGDLTLNGNDQSLESRNSISLTNRENRLLQYFILNANKELSVNELISHVWDENDTVDQEDLWINICYLRQKLQAIQSQVTISGEKTGPFMIAC
ncbi:two-component system response regulator [Limosilactobacillus reuteri]|jgi:DNA-binding response OmpR family regulator|uniref:Response regulator n=2 Tax=Limosilactobacillus reuteri TaxID=1598 RepID=A0A1C1ZHY3_LIMRT|nr:response regulator transcription factor [Limosilactobacillus reuteri]AGR63558.1 transcriptional regulator [Limosilactobacillus reuteri TD1]MBW3350889.1 response regulator transcription factor [Limosilactobacillus reuteri]MCC4400292.1 response regulator transcription factor [Limosilactobacillus reuteri]MCC4403708.1 response regulator transcription factor [Limosilactobacillus reuteri]MCC4412836.1 response regulator transcription factor [Limosilactobacillus reuteri]